MRWPVNLVYFVAGLLYLPVLLYQMLIQRKNRRGWRQRLGSVPRRDPARPRVWIHAVSLGEMNATPSLVREVQRLHPGWEFVFSTTTDTGFARGVQLYGAERVFRFPLDFSLIVNRALRRVAPRIIVLMELEAWYNFVTLARRRGIAVVIANGRLTERSARRFHRVHGVTRRMFAALDWVGAQDAAIAERFVRVGVPAERVEIVGSMKWDTAQVSDSVEGDMALAAALGIPRNGPLWVCGSTGTGEEEMLLDAYRRLRAEWPDRVKQSSVAPGNPRTASVPPVLALVPRKPERFSEVAAIITRAGWRCVRRSQCPDGVHRPALAHDEVVLGDTMGELRKFYALADAVFVGRSLVPMGGSDPMEVAALGKPMVVGLHMENFADPLERLRTADAIRVVPDAAGLSAAVGELLVRPEEARRRGAAGRNVVRAQQGATRRTAERIIALLPDIPPVS